MASDKDRDGLDLPARSRSAYQAARERTQSAYETARSRAGDVTDQLAVYPVGAVVGGFLVGALVAALLPRSEREEKLLGKTGKKITTAAREAAQRGLNAGREQFDEIRTKAAEKVGAAVADVVGGKQ
jgi:hypothetical protein